MSDNRRPPSGCHWCGIDRRLHFQRWTDAAGWHNFTEPSRELIAERMRAKYADRAADQRRVATTPSTDTKES